MAINTPEGMRGPVFCIDGWTKNLARIENRLTFVVGLRPASATWAAVPDRESDCELTLRQGASILEKRAPL